MRIKLTMIFTALLSTAYAASGIDAYRQGQYDMAFQPLVAEAASSPEANFYLGKMYLYGYGQAQDTDKAVTYFQTAASRGYLLAILWMGKYMLSQNHPDEAFNWFKKSAAQGHEWSNVYVAGAYLNGYGVKKNEDAARQYFIAAAKQGNTIAQTSLAMHFLASKSQQNKKMGIIWLNKAAEKGDKQAMFQLAEMFDKGQGVLKDPLIAEKWKKEAEGYVAMPEKLTAEQQQAWYISAGKTTALNETEAGMQGILAKWQAPQSAFLKQKNTAPKMEKVQKNEIFQPEFAFVKPSDVSMDEYFAYIAPLFKGEQLSEFRYPRYPLNKDITSMLGIDGDGLIAKNNAVPIHEANWYVSVNPFQHSANLNDESGVSKKEHYQAYLEQLYSQAILGDTTAQFELGQLYEYGVGVNQDLKTAEAYYKLAAQQQDLRAEYNLAIMNLANFSDAAHLKEGSQWLMDAAFKGNPNAQYVLAHLYSVGLKDETGTSVIVANPAQSDGMFFAAASSHHPLAEYQLASQLATESVKDLSVSAKNKRLETIRTLYRSAHENGVEEAALPLAFYNAMGNNPNEQNAAYEVVRTAAMKDNKAAALLLGLMYDRGIGTSVNHDVAMEWYQKASDTTLGDFMIGSYDAIDGNHDMAKQGLEKSANAGMALAKLNLAVLMQKTNMPFIPLLEEARQAGNAKAGLLLADYYLKQSSDPTSLQNAARIYEYFAEKGDANAALKLAYCYDEGMGATVDKHQAFRWYQEAARQGLPIAEYQLGQMYQMGTAEQSPNYAKAKSLYEKAEMSYPMAAVALGFMEETVFDDYQAALKAYQVAVDSKMQSGYFNLGLIYQYGKGFAPDESKARSLLSQATGENKPSWFSASSH